MIDDDFNSTATMEPTNSSPSGVMRDRLGHLAKDVAALAELQAELLQVELSEWLRKCVAPVTVLAVVAAVLSLASLPLLLLSLAYCLATYGGLSMALATLVAGLTGLIVASVCVFIAWRTLRRQRSAFARFKIELARNAKWLKQVLTRPGTVADHEPW